MTRRFLPWLALGGLAACSSCRESHPTEAGPDASASAPTPSSAPAPSSAATAGPPATKPVAACRPLAQKGGVHVVPGDAPFSPSSPVDGKTWLRLDKDALLATRHGVSSRELSAKGPALVEPCVGGDEDWIVAEGTVETAAGPGARPGAEVNVFTPLGTISYGDAHIRIVVKPGRVEIAALGGEAWAQPAAGVTLTGPEHIAGPKGKLTFSGKVTAQSLVAACEKAAEVAESAASAVLTRSPPDAGADAGSLGERAATHLHARRAARAACGAARGAVEADSDESLRQALRARLASANRRWQTIAGPPPGP